MPDTIEAAREVDAKAPPRTLNDTLNDLSEQFVRTDASGGRALLPTGIAAQLRRMDPDEVSANAAALVPVLVRAGLPVERMGDNELRRWATVAHLVATLAGTGGLRAHRGGRSLGRALAGADWSEARFMRLLNSHGEASRVQVARLARFLKAKGVHAVDLAPLARMVLHDGTPTAETARLRLARDFYGSRAGAEDAVGTAPDTDGDTND